MNGNTQRKTDTPFPRIHVEMLDRLSKEAEERTMRPQSVDWEEIHRQAAVARNGG